MADTYEKDLAQKSSLTTSDYIRVVGSDNVSYKQGMGTVASIINSAQPISTHSGSIKQWALQLNGQAIICTSPTRTTDLPDIPNKYGIAWTKSYVADSNKWVNLYWSPTNGNDIYICSNMSNTDTWTAWQKVPTRAEIDALNSNRMYRSGDSVTIARNYLAGYLASNGKVSITVPLSKPIYDPTQATGSVTCSDISLFRVGGSQNVKSMVTSVIGYNRYNGVDVEITLSSVPSGFTWGNVTVDFRGTITF